MNPDMIVKDSARLIDVGRTPRLSVLNLFTVLTVVKTNLTKLILVWQRECVFAFFLFN